MDDAAVLYGVAGPVAWLRLHRPESLNAINFEVITGLADGLSRAEADPTVRLIAITGSGRAFSAGADIHVLDNITPLGFIDFLDRMNAVWPRFRTSLKPVVAAINGVTVGAGFELALLCDFRYAVRGARIGSKESHINQPMTNGSTFLLPRLIGEARAKEICLTGALIETAEAQTIGLVTRVLDDRAALEQAVQDLAAELTIGGPQAVGLIKRCLNASGDLAVALVGENEAATRCFVSEDQKEGLRAFLEKRSPRWSGR